MWVSSTSPGGARRVGEHGYVQATFLTGYQNTGAVFDSYRAGWRAAGRGNDVPINRLAYAALVYTADNESDARAGAEKLLWYMTGNKVPAHYRNPPCYLPPAVQAKMLRSTAADPLGGNRGGPLTVEKVIETGLMFAGTPDQVYAQFRKFYEHVGGFGHLLIMGQAGFLEHDETVRGIRSFARHVYPRLQQEFGDLTISGNGR